MHRFGWILVGILVGVVAMGFYHTQSVQGYEAQVAGFRQDMKQVKSNQGSFADSVGEQEQGLKEVSVSGKRIMHPGGRSGVENIYFDPWNTFSTQMRHAEMLLAKEKDEAGAKVLGLSALSILKTFCSEAVLPPHIISREMRELLRDYYHFRNYPEDWIALTTEIGGC